MTTKVFLRLCNMASVYILSLLSKLSSKWRSIFWDKSYFLDAATTKDKDLLVVLAYKG